MTHDDAADPLFRLLAQLPSDAPPAAAIERVRARSHDVLTKRQQQQRTVHQDSVGRLVDSALLFVCFTYLAGAVAEAVRLSILIR
jgi:hypothetical protein